MHVAQVVVLIFTAVAPGEAGVTLVRHYQFHEPHDKGVLFSMAVTPEQDVLSLVPSRGGTWRLIRVRGWFSEKPSEQTIDVPGIAVPKDPPKTAPRLTFLQMKLLVTPDGSFAIAIASGIWRNSAGVATDDDVVSVIDLHAFNVAKTTQGPPLAQELPNGSPGQLRGDGATRTREYALDRAGHLVIREKTDLRSLETFCDPHTGQTVGVSTQFNWNRSEIDLRFLTLPDLASVGEGHYRETLTCGGRVREDAGGSTAALLARTLGRPVPLADFLDIFSNFQAVYGPKDPLKHRCPTTGTTRDGQFEKESCFGFPTRTFWGNTGTPKEWRENILSLRTGMQIGTVDELASGDSVESQLAEHDGQNYLLIIEGGTRLKIYAIAE
jgi:hypothetical protein